MTNKYTNIHTHTHTHTFWKTISRNQACTHSQPMGSCGRAPGLQKGLQGVGTAFLWSRESSKMASDHLQTINYKEISAN